MVSGRRVKEEYCEKNIIIPEEMEKGYTRREFLKLFQIAGVGVAVGATRFIAGCQDKTDPI